MSRAEERRFHGFNAKYLPVEDVAATFIPPPQWDTLIQNGHTLLLGPRGAGKTTLLKMLTSRGLVAWQHPQADDARASVAFTGVFITTDRTWSEQVGAVGGEFSEQHRTTFALATFTAHVLQALVAAAADRVHDVHSLHHVPLNEAAEAEIAEGCAAAWKLSGPPIVTLRALQVALTDRVNEIRELAARELLVGEEGRAQRLATGLPLTQFATAAFSLIDRFNVAAKQPDGLWCLLFDELELAPPSVVTQLTGALRGGDRRVLLKLSLAPYTEGAKLLEDALGAQQAHDFQIESLSYPHKTDALDFCRALLASRLGISVDELDEDAVLGRSRFASTEEERGVARTSYRLDSRRMRPVIRLAENDVTFGAWLAHAGVDLQRLETLDEPARAQTLRKIITITQVREHARSSDAVYEKSGRRRRSRKSFSLYGGAQSLYAMAEGNPRWFFNLIEPLVVQNGSATAAVQSDRIRKINRRFRIVLTALPLAPSDRQRAQRGVLPIIDAIGVAFSERLVDGAFTPDPPLTFTVDDKVDASVIRELEFALNVGGIVHMPKEEDPDLLLDLRGQTFRLAYMLAPTFPIPLTAGRPLDLSTILAATRPSWELSRSVSEQLSMHIDEEESDPDEGEEDGPE